MRCDVCSVLCVVCSVMYECDVCGVVCVVSVVRNMSVMCVV